MSINYYGTDVAIILFKDIVETITNAGNVFLSNNVKKFNC